MPQNSSRVIVIGPEGSIGPLKCSRKPKLILTLDQKELDFFPIRAGQSTGFFFM